MLTYFPKYFTNRAIALYFVTLLTISVAFMQYAMHWYWFVFGIVEVVGFFYFANQLSKQWGRMAATMFAKRLFWVAFAIRALYVLFSYLFYTHMTGVPFEFGVADSGFYDEMARYGHRLISQGNLNLLHEFDRYAGGLNYSDSGYPIYLSVIYFLTDDSIFLARLLKAVWSAWTCVLIYKLAVRNFGESTGRMAAIFCMLMPNMIYYCGMHLKETEMVFLIVLFIERADFVLRAPKIPWLQTCIMVLVGIGLFMFRTVLGAVAFAALFAAMTFTSQKVAGWGKKIVLSILVLLLVGISFSNQIVSEVNEVWKGKADNQSTSLQWRSNRKGGNQLAKYAGSAVFAPLIFTIPFPTMVETAEQENQRLIHGGNYVKNITSFFTILALLSLLIGGEWRKHVLSLAFLGGYLLVIAFSAFAQSERFHMPALPFALMFAAYGISQLQNKHKQRFLLWMVVIFVANVGWAWFKLKGRGLV